MPPLNPAGGGSIPLDEDNTSDDDEDDDNEDDDVDDDELVIHPGDRWMILALACMVMFGNFFAYDLPASLNNPLQKYLGSEDESYQYQLNLFYSLYSLPNVILPFFGGWLVDVFGTRRLMVILSSLVCIGQLLFSVGVSLKAFWIMHLGRILFGVGGESLGVAQTRMTTKWFKGKELAFAMGVNLSVARLGSVFNDFISPYIALKSSVPTAIWFGFVTCFVSLLCGLELNRIDARGTKVGSRQLQLQQRRWGMRDYYVSGPRDRMMMGGGGVGGVYKMTATAATSMSISASVDAYVNDDTTTATSNDAVMIEATRPPLTTTDPTITTSATITGQNQCPIQPQSPSTSSSSSSVVSLHDRPHHHHRRRSSAMSIPVSREASAAAVTFGTGGRTFVVDSRCPSWDGGALGGAASAAGANVATVISERTPGSNSHSRRTKRQQRTGSFHDGDDGGGLQHVGHSTVTGSLSFNAVLDFPFTFWLICIIMGLMYATVIPFNTIHSAFLQRRWYKDDPATASQVMAIPDIISAVLVPFCGTYVDKYGRRCKILILCGFLMGAVHSTFTFASSANIYSPLPLLAVLGFSYALLLTFWPCIPLVVQEKSLATAFGIATAIQNASLTIIPVVVAALINADPSYRLVEIFFSALSFLGVALTIWLDVYDYRCLNSVLDRPSVAAQLRMRVKALERGGIDADSEFLFPFPDEPISQTEVRIPGVFSGLDEREIDLGGVDYQQLDCEVSGIGSSDSHQGDLSLLRF